MGLLEMIAEWRRPHPIGTVDVGRPALGERAAWMVLAHVVISVALLALGIIFIGIPNGVAGVIGCVVYVVLATILHPRPDYSNVGLLGGLIDHPFRWSDDYNRFLAFLGLFLWPGRVVGSGFLDLIRLFVIASRPRE